MYISLLNIYYYNSKYLIFLLIFRMYEKIVSEDLDIIITIININYLYYVNSTKLHIKKKIDISLYLTA